MHREHSGVVDGVVKLRASRQGRLCVSKLRDVSMDEGTMGGCVLAVFLTRL